MEAHGRLVRIRARERAEAAEGVGRRVLVEVADGGRDARLDVIREPPAPPRRRRATPTRAFPRAGARRRRGGARARRPPRPPRRNAASWRRGGKPGHRGRRREGRDERGQAARQLRVQQVPGDERVRRVRGLVENRAPGLDGVAFVRPQPREPEVELDDRGVGVELRELLEPVERAVRPLGERGADLRLERVVPREQEAAAAVVSAPVERGALREVARLGIGAEAERERERRADPGGASAWSRDADGPEPPPAERTAAAATTAPPRARPQRRGARCDAGRSPPNGNRGRRSYSSESNGDVPRAARAGQVRDRRDLHRRGARAPRVADGSLFVDVREPDEWDEGHIPDAIYTGRGRLEQRIEGLVPDKTRPLVVYCSAGSRSAFSVEGARGARLRERRQPRERLLRLEAQRLSR